MKKYNNEEYYSVVNKTTGKKIVDCAEWLDAISMVNFDPQNRTITKNKFIMGPVVDIEIPKALPTTNITATNVKENGCAPRKDQLFDASPLRLPEDKRIPINTK